MISTPRRAIAASPTYTSLEPVPTMIDFAFGVPITAGKTDLGESSPAIPALHRPEPLSMTTAGLLMVAKVTHAGKKAG